MGGGIPLGQQAAGLDHHSSVSLHREPLAPDIIGTGPNPRRITLRGGVFDREVGSALLKEQSRACRRGMPIHNRRQRLYIDADRVQYVFGDSGTVGQRHSDRLTDIANLSLRNDRLMIGDEARQGLQPYRDPRHRAADVRRGDDGVHTGDCQGCSSVDRANARMRVSAAQNYGVE